jgi:hypothetical protein
LAKKGPILQLTIGSHISHRYVGTRKVIGKCVYSKKCRKCCDFLEKGFTHRIRCFGKYVFGLAYSPVSASTCTMVDAYRLKRNFAYCWLMSYHTESFDIFQEKAKSVVEQHFNNHWYCDDWCSMKKASVEKTATGNLKYRCKVTNKLLYTKREEARVANVLVGPTS